MKRIVVIGASSFIGANLCVRLRQKHHVVGTYFHHRPRIDTVPCVKLPLSADSPMTETLLRLRPECIIYCAGERNESRCQTDPMGSLFLNSDAAIAIAESFVPRGVRFFFFSSSKVFSGKKGNYDEGDTPDPTTAYGQAKREAEEALLEMENTFILRLGTIFGLGGVEQDSFLSRLLYSLWHGERVRLIRDEFRSFVAVEDLAHFVELLVEASPSKCGLYHVGSGIKETHFDFAEQVVAEFGLSQKLIEAVAGHEISGFGFRPEDRGRDLSLNGERLKRELTVAPKTSAFALRFLRHRLERGLQ